MKVEKKIKILYNNNMKILSIEVNNFRNLAPNKIVFSSGLNVLQGKNAQGKTNLIEAIYYCAISKSFKTTKIKDLLFCENQNVAESFSLKTIVEKKCGKVKIEIKCFANGKKFVLLNGNPIKRIADLFGELNCVFFSPSELKLVKDAPEDRRNFMDIDISQVSKNYFYFLIKYNKILASRNKLLKEKGSSAIDQIDIYTRQLCEVGAKIILSRINFLKKLTPFAKLAHCYLTDNNEDLEIKYCGIIGEGIDEIAIKMKKMLDENLEKDIEKGFTSIGPHRDDIKLFINEKEIKTYGSQGQQRSVALSLKLAELEVIRNECGEMPVLLLDDVFSELDKARRKRLLSFTRKAQTILTCNEFDEQNIVFENFHVENGNIKKIKN